MLIMETNLINIPLTEVYANPNQPRKESSPAKLQELAASIRQYGYWNR
jgi:ParB-like chromosome segregation protein Spo0J